MPYGASACRTREESEFRGAVESGKALIKARTYKKKFNGRPYGVLKASEGWLGATGSTPDGTFYRVADNGIRCITAPCPSTTAYGLNGATTQPHQGELRDDGHARRSGVARPRVRSARNDGGHPDRRRHRAAEVSPDSQLRTVRDGLRVLPPRDAPRGQGVRRRGNLWLQRGPVLQLDGKDICGAADAGGRAHVQAGGLQQDLHAGLRVRRQDVRQRVHGGRRGVSVSSAGACAKGADRRSAAASSAAACASPPQQDVALSSCSVELHAMAARR